MSSICDDLRAAMLQAAIQGKLTEQLEADGDAEELLTQIKNEKDKFITEGIIKESQKPHGAPEKSVPFAIPENWRWCSPEEIGIVVVGATPSKNNSSFWEAGTIPWLPSGCCQDCEVTNNCAVIKYITDEAYDSCSTKKMSADTVLIALTGATAGKVGLLRFEACANQSVVGITPFKKNMAKYLFYQLMGRRNEILSDCVGSAQPHISKDYITKMVFPIPPAKEQERIVRRVEYLLARVADLEQSADALASLKKAFPEDIRASLLQAAMRGELTEQLPEDGDVEELLEQIKAEKEKLIAEGKIKKQKPLAPITDDEIPFSIPENWKWVRWGDIVNIVSARRVHQSDWKKNGIPFYRAREIGKLADYDSVDNDLFVSQELFNEYSKSGLPKKNDLMVTAVGTLGKTYVVKESDKFYYKDASVLCFENYHCDPFFLKYLMSSDIMKSQIESNSGGTTVGTLTIVRMNDYILPLPPLDEQKRIVERLNILIQNINAVGELIASE